MTGTIVITGGGGFLGGRLANAISALGRICLPDGRVLNAPRILLVDHPDAEPPADLPGSISYVACDIAKPGAFASLPDDATSAIYHLAAVVSGAAEADLDLGLRVNLDGTRAVLDAVRATGRPLPVIGTSSLAVFGGALPPVLTEATATQPTNSYGIQKAIGELLMNDYRRRGLAEARVLRLPTIVVRPGRPNAAASSFASSIIREPLAGHSAVCPVRAELAMWLASPDTAIAALIRALEVPLADWPAFTALNVPGVTATVAEMLDALEAVGGANARARVRMQPDPRIEAIVSSWPARFDCALAHGLGFTGDHGISEIVARYAAEIPA